MLYTPTFESIVDWLSPFNVLTYYHLSERDWDQINIPLESVRIVGPFLAWVVVSYGIGVIYRAKARSARSSEAAPTASFPTSCLPCR